MIEWIIYSFSGLNSNVFVACQTSSFANIIYLFIYKKNKNKSNCEFCFFIYFLLYIN